MSPLKNRLEGRLLISAATLLLCGCAAGFRMPMTASDLARYDSGDALVAYLGQPDASAAVCDLRAETPHPAAFTPELRASLIDGLADGKIEPALWRRCVDVLMKGLPADDVSSLFDQLLRADVKMLEDSHLAVDPGLADRLTTVHRLYLDRKPGLDAHPAVLLPLIADLRAVLAKKKLQPLAATYGQELLATLDVEQGNWQGRPVDAALLDSLAAAGNEMTLTRLAERLPDAAARTEAKRRLVRIHVALSPFPEVRSAGPAVEEAMLRDGHNRVDLAAHPLLHAALDGTRATVRGVLVRQEIWQRSATLLAWSTARPSLSVLPELSLRGVLLAQLDSISRPVTICSRSSELDPSPCLKASDVSIDNPFAYLDRGAAFHFRDKVSMDSVLPLAQQPLFSLPILIGGKPGVTLQWGLEFEKPDDLLFAGRGPGSDGPTVEVQVDHRNPQRFVFNADGGEIYSAVIEADDAPVYRVGSVGAQGPGGASGNAGEDGSSGSECGNGGDGGRGGDGGPGGTGGDGGEVDVSVDCGALSCASVLGLLHSVIVSRGGAGGPGGSGGRGGSGGSGGSGRPATTHTDSNGNTVTDDPGCFSGTSGSSGSSGSNGPDGAPGRAGVVRFSPR